MDELGRLGWVAQRSFAVEGLLFGVRTNSRPFMKWTESVLRQFRVADDEADPYYSVLVGESENGVGKRYHILYRESDAMVRSFDLGLVGRALLLEIESLTYRARNDALYLNAAVVSGHGANILLPAESISFLQRPGKKLERAGISLPLTWTTAVDPDAAEAFSPPGTLPLPDDAVERLDQLGAGDNGRKVAALEQPRPQRLDAICLAGIFLDEEIRTVGKAEGVYRLAGLTRNLSSLDGSGLDGLARLVERVPCFELPPDFYDESIATLTSFLREIATTGDKQG